MKIIPKKMKIAEQLRETITSKEQIEIDEIFYELLGRCCMAARNGNSYITTNYCIETLNLKERFEAQGFKINTATEGFMISW